MKKFTSPPPAAPELTPARRRLADLQRQRAETLAAVQNEIGNANRLERFHAAVAPARVALDAFDSQQAVGMANFARGLVTGLPRPNSGRRAELASALADAELASASATLAQEQFRAAAQLAKQPLPRLDLEIRKAAKVVAVTEAAKLLPAITAAIATAETLHSRLAAARVEAMSGIDFGSTDFGEVHAAISAFDEARGLAEARPQMTDFAADWRKFTAALEQSAEIDFDAAQATVVPPVPFSPHTADVATAAMLAAASFPTRGIQR